MNIRELIRTVRNDVRQGECKQDELLLLCDKVEEILEQKEKTFGDVKIGTHLVAIEPIVLYEGTTISKGEKFEVVDISYNAVKDAYTASIKPINKSVLEQIGEVKGINETLAVYLNKQYNRDFEIVETDMVF